MTSILCAVANNSSRIVELMVAIPGSVSDKNLDYSLILAAKNGYIESAGHLLKAGSNPDAEDSCGNTALKAASENGHHDVVRLLVDHKCCVNYRNHSGSTALHYAARWGHVACVQLLLDAGAKINSVNTERCTALITATKTVKQQVMRVLIQRECNINLADRSGRTALHYASERAFGVEQLIKAGANPDVQDSKGLTPIILASIEGFCNILKILIAAGCDVNIAHPSKNRTAIHYLSMKGHTDCVQELLHAGCHPDVADSAGHTPLWHAINHNRTETVKLLLHTNCGLKVCDDVQHSPLKLAIEKGNSEILKMVLLAGCETKSFRQWLSTGMIHRYHFDNPELFDWLADMTRTAHTLKWCCRQVIRQCMGHEVVQKMECLNVPETMKKYLALKELEDI